MSEQSSQSRFAEKAVISPRQFVAYGAVSASWLIILACVHVMYVGFVIYGSKPRTAAVLATLTENGRQWYMPERELPIYVVGTVLTLVCSLATAYFWQRTERLRDRDDPGFDLRGCFLSLAIAVLGSGLNLSWLLAGRMLGILLGLSKPVIAAVLVVPAAVEALLFCFCQRQDTIRRLRSLLVQVESEVRAAADRIRQVDSSKSTTIGGTSPRRKLRYRLFDTGIVVFICFVIYVPRTDLMAGSDFVFQHFHHWDHFAMGPAIGLLKGKRLATQVYCQYGFGWALLLAKLDPVYRLSYGHAYKIAVIYGCLYYSGLYWLLRRLTSNPAWAIAGLMLALRLQVFHGGRLEIPLWYIPSASILRTPFDIWVFLLLATHWRCQRPSLLLTAGALVGLSLLFIVDTGIYLTLAFAGYNLLWLTSSSRTGSAGAEDHLASTARSKFGRRRVGLSAAAFIVAALVLISGLVASSGSAVFSPGYFRQWLEVLWVYPSGISMLPMIQETAGVVFSYWFTLLFLAHISAGIIRSFYRPLQSEDAVVCCIAALGLMYLIYYIGNSHAYSMFQLSTPFCIVAAFTAERVVSAIYRYSTRFRPTHEQLAVYLIAMCSIVVVIVNPQFRGYPSLINSILNPPPQNVLCYAADLKDICIAANQHPDTGSFQRVVSEMRTITSQGKTIAVIANDDTSYYVVSRSTLWCRYTPLLPELMTKSMLNGVNQELSTGPVDYVFLKKKDPAEDSFWAGMQSPKTTDSWMTLSETTHRLYHYYHDSGPFEVWRR